MIVADTNLVVYYILPTVHTERAQRRRKLDRDWRVPRLFEHELTNALTRYLGQKMIDRDEAIALHRMAMSLVTVEHEPFPPLDIFNAHLQTGCTSYDCEFLLLARRLGVPLVTLDQQLLRAASDCAVEI